MISFFICLFLLIGGYFVYGKVVENTFAPDDRETPAVKINDGVDYVVMPQWKLFLVQLLNIAGLGPIFGAMQGALWGPVVFLWITFGTIFAGGVHDYFSGMLSERNDGASISEVCGIYLGGFMKNVMRVFSVVLLVMVGTVFAVGPAGLIVTLFKNGNVSGIVTSTEFWLWIILAYYFIATFISIDKIIGRIYPLFGICLIIMALGVALGIFTHSQYQIPEIWSHFTNMHPKATPIWSVMFITVACGAISGFHATQSPLMARCMKSEKQGHFVFYGAMVAEGIIDGKVVCTQKKMPSRRSTKLRLYADTQKVNLVADGSDFIVVVAEVTDDSGNVRRLAKENIVFTVEGEGEIIGDARIGANPRAVEFGSAPLLIRSTRKAGKIKVKAHVQFEGTQAPTAAEMEFESVPAELPFCYDEKYCISQDTPSLTVKATLSENATDGKVQLTEEERQRVLDEVERQQTEFGIEK